MKQSINQRIANHYLNLLNINGDTAATAQYSSRETQERRFEILSCIDCLTDRRILDFGCGTGHLATFLSDNGHKIASYTGVDIVPELLDVAKGKHPKARFGQFEDFCNERFDYIFVSGVFNNRRRDNRKFYQSIIRSLFDLCDYGLAFNMMSTFVDYQDPELFYEDPGRVLRFVKSEVTPFVLLRHDYSVKPGVIPFEFAVYLFRNTR